MKFIVLIFLHTSRLCIAWIYLLSISGAFPAFGQSQPASPTNGASSAPPAAQSQPPAPANQQPPSQSPSPALPAAQSAPQNPQATPDTPPAPTTAKPAAPATTPPGNTETPAVVVEGKSADTLLGKPVQSASGDDMGRIIDVMVDHTGLVRAAIIDFGGFLGVGTRKIAVDWRVLHFPPDGSMDKIVADLSQDQLRVAPVYKPGEPVVIVGRADVAPPAPAPAQSPASPAPSAPAQTAPAPQQSPPTQNAPAQPAPAQPTPPTAPAQPSPAPQDNAPTQAP